MKTLNVFIVAMIAVLAAVSGLAINNAQNRVQREKAAAECCTAPAVEAIEEPATEEEREFDYLRHQLRLYGVEYMVSEKKYAGTGESEYVISYGDRSWILSCDKPRYNCQFVQSHGKPYVKDSETAAGMIDIRNERDELIMTFSKSINFMLHSQIEWLRVRDADTATKVIEAVKAKSAKVGKPC